MHKYSTELAALVPDAIVGPGRRDHGGAASVEPGGAESRCFSGRTRYGRRKLC